MGAAIGTIPYFSTYQPGALPIASTVYIEIVDSLNATTAQSWNQSQIDFVGKAPSIIPNATPVANDRFAFFQAASGLPKACTLGNLGIPFGNVPTGGTAGQMLVKLSATNFDAGWSSIIQGPFGVVGNSNFTGISSFLGTTLVTGLVGISGTTNITGILTNVGTATFTGGTFGVNATAAFTGIFGAVGTATFTGTHGIIGTSNLTGIVNIVGTTNLTGLLNVVGTAQFTGGTFGVQATTNFTGIYGVVGTTLFTSARFGVVGTALFTGTFGVVGTTNFTGIHGIVGTSLVTGTVGIVGTTLVTGIVGMVGSLTVSKSLAAVEPNAANVLHVVGSSTNCVSSMWAYGTPNAPGTLSMNYTRSDVSPTTHSAVPSSGYWLGLWGANGSDGTNFNEAARITIMSDGAFSAGSSPGRIVFATVPSGSTTFVEAMRIDNQRNMVIGTGTIASAATDGFVYLPATNGTPTGTPTTYAGHSPMVVDSTNNRLYFYSSGAWRNAGP